MIYYFVLLKLQNCRRLIHIFCQVWATVRGLAFSATKLEHVVGYLHVDLPNLWGKYFELRGIKVGG